MESVHSHLQLPPDFRIGLYSLKIDLVDESGESIGVFEESGSLLFQLESGS